MTDEPKNAEGGLPAHTAQGTADAERAEAPSSSRGAHTLVGVAPQAGAGESPPSGAPPSGGAPVVVTAGTSTHDETPDEAPPSEDEGKPDEAPQPDGDQEFELPGTIGPDRHRRMLEASDLEAREAFVQALTAHLSEAIEKQRRTRVTRWLLVVGCAVGISFPLMLWLGGREPPENLPRERSSPSTVPSEGAPVEGHATQAEEGTSPSTQTR